MSFGCRIAAGLIAAVYAAASSAGEPGYPPVSYVISGGFAPMVHPVVRVMPDGRVLLAGGAVIAQLEASTHGQLVEQASRIVDTGLPAPACPDCRVHDLHVGDSHIAIASDIGGASPVSLSDPPRAAAFAALHAILARAETVDRQGGGDNDENSESDRCFRTLMSGDVDWGGGTNWNPRNARSLCEGTPDAATTITCFRDALDAGEHWRAAIAACSERSD